MAVPYSLRRDDDAQTQASFKENEKRRFAPYAPWDLEVLTVSVCTCLYSLYMSRMVNECKELAGVKTNLAEPLEA